MSTMDSGTLVTFLLQTPRTVKSVQLRGSWDNFGRTYPMERDKRSGSGHWRGCHLFTDIICDGPMVQPSDCRRNGALLQGGRYWYYYQLDDDVEVHDVTEPSTTDCPFLPGQRVNVLDVPIQARDCDRPLSSSFEVFTLDPDDKFRAPKAPRPDSYYLDQHNQQRPVTRYGSQSSNGFGNFSNVMDDFRHESEALSESTSICKEPSITFPRWQLLDLADRPRTTGSFMWGEYLCFPLKENGLTEMDMPLQSRPTTSTGIARSNSEKLADWDKPYALSSDRTTTITDGFAKLNIRSVEQVDNRESVPECEEQSATVYSYSCSLQHTTSTSSARTSGMWSSLTSGSYAGESKCYSRVSQPNTPTMSAVGDVIIETTLDEHPFQLSSAATRELTSGFLGYSLSEAEYSSVLTIRNLETANSCTSGSGSHQYDDRQRKQYVEAWNDGNKHRTTALQDLVDDLGYLGSMIA